MKKKAIIISIKGYHLSIKEKMLIANEKPWGLILFKRNIKSLKQVIELIKKIRKFSKDSKFPIMIDEEGETVSRLSKIINHNLSQKLFGDNNPYFRIVSAILFVAAVIQLTGSLSSTGNANSVFDSVLSPDQANAVATLENQVKKVYNY